MSTDPRRFCYPTDSTEEERAFAAPYLTLLPEGAGQRRYALRASYDALRWIVRAGAAWRKLPGDFPSWHVVYDRARRWLAAGCFEAMAHDLWALLRLAKRRAAAPRAAILDSRILRSTPESGPRAGYDGAKRRTSGWPVMLGLFDCPIRIVPPSSERPQQTTLCSPGRYPCASQGFTPRLSQASVSIQKLCSKRAWKRPKCPILGTPRSAGASTASSCGALR